MDEGDVHRVVLLAVPEAAWPDLKSIEDQVLALQEQRLGDEIDEHLRIGAIAMQRVQRTESDVG